MPKKPTSNRLDKLFEDINDESAIPEKKQSKKTGSSVGEKKSSKPVKPAAKPVVHATSLSQTTPLPPPTETTTLALTGSDTTPATLALGFQMDQHNWATLQVVDENAVRVWDANEEALVRQVTDQLTQALENARLFQETRSRAEELAILNEMDRELTTEYELEEIASTVYKFTTRLMDTANLFISLYDAVKEEVNPFFVINENQRVISKRRKLGKGLSDYILRTREALFIPEDVPDRMKKLGIEVLFLANTKDMAKCWLGAPLMVGDTPIGVIGVQSVETPNLYTERHRDLLIAVAGRAAVAIENARLFQEARRRAQEMTTLAEVGREISATLDLQTVLERIAGRALTLLNAVTSAVYMPSADFQSLKPIVALGDEAEEIKQNEIAVGLGIVGKIAQTHKGEIINNASTDPRAVTIQGTEDVPDERLMAVPILARGELSGVMAVWRVGPGTEFEPSELDFLASLAQQASIAVENASLFREARTRAEELTVLNELAQRLSAQLDVEQVLQEIYRGVSRLIDTSNFYIGLYSPERNEVSFPLNVSESVIDKSIVTIRADQGLTGYIIRTRAPLLISENLTEAMEKLGIEVVGEPSRSWLGVPLLLGERVLGVMALQSYSHGKAYDEHDRDILLAFAGQAAISIQNARLFQETQQRSYEISALADVATTASQSLDLKLILTEVLQKVFALLQFEGGLVTIFNEKRGKLERAVRIGLPGDVPADPAEGLQGSLCEYVYQSGNPLAINDLRQGAPVDVQDNIDRGYLGYLGLPLTTKGTAIGTLCVFRKNTDPIPDSAISLGQSIGNQIGFAIENARLFQETQRRADIERLTGEISTNFVSINPAETDQGVNKALETLGEFLGVDRAYVFTFRQDGAIMDNANEWCAPGVSSHIVELQNVPSARFPYLIKSLKRLGAFRSSRIADLPDEASAEKEEFEREGIQAIVCIPMILREQLLGYIGLDSVRQERIWEDDEINLLRIVSDIIVTSLNRKSTSLALEKSEADLRALFAAMTDVIIVYDREGRYTRIAPTNPSRLFRPPVEMLGKTIPEVLPPDIARLLMDAIQRTLETGETVQVEYPLVIGDNPYWFDGSFSKLSQTEVFLVARDITDRKKAEAEISKFKLGIDNSTDAVFITDINGMITYVNPAFERIYGFTPVEAVGRTPRILKSGRMEQEYYQRLWNTLLSKQTVSSEEIVNKAKDGRIVYIAETNSPILNEAGDILGFLSVHHDISERKQAEQEIRRFKLGIDQSTDAVFITDVNGTITYANPGFEKIYGYSEVEAIGQTPRIIKSGLLTKENYEQFWGTLLARQTVSGEIINKTKDGRFVSIAGTNSPIMDESGNILGFLAVHHDITDRKKVEETLKRRNEYLSATAEIGRLVTSTLDMPTLFSRTVNLVREKFGFYHAGLFIIEETGFNALLQSATGEAGAEMLRQGHKLPVGSKSVVGQVAESGQSVIVNDTQAGEVHRFNPLLPDTRAEAAIPLRIGMRTIGVLDIQSTEANAFSEEDIAVLQSLADQIAISIDNARSYELSMQAVKEMREADRLKSQFLANMSHELRTPLNSIIGFSRVILKGIDGPITDLQQQDLLAIHNSGQHLLGLINDILDLSRIEAGKMELTFDEVHLPELINSVMSTVTGLVRDKPIQLVRNIPAELPTVRADSMRVRQVLLNLLSNAAKFTDEGSITVSAIVTDKPGGHQEIMVRVTDTGPGISPEDQKKLFQPFSQVDASPTRKTGGSGLGLSISNHLIQMHGGRMGVESDSGQGSAFYFTLPAFRVKAPEVAASGAPGNRTILAIDDDPQVISLYERYLQPQGYQLVAVSDPTRAVERAKQLKPFAITLDIMMPVIDGWHVLADLKSDPETRDIPVVVCSIVEDQEKGFSLGAADYLLKPILEDDLLNALDRLNPDGSIREVLIIDDKPDDLRLLSKILTEHGRYHPIVAEGGAKGWDAIQMRAPHAVILDLFMPEMDGFTILEKMRTSDQLRHLPVIVVSAYDLTAEQQAQLEEFGQRMIQKSLLTEQQLLDTLDQVLKRVGREG